MEMSLPTYFPESDEETTQETPPYELEACQATEELQDPATAEALMAKMPLFLPRRREWNVSPPSPSPSPGQLLNGHRRDGSK